MHQGRSIGKNAEIVVGFKRQAGNGILYCFANLLRGNRVILGLYAFLKVRKGGCLQAGLVGAVLQLETNGRYAIVSGNLPAGLHVVGLGRYGEGCDRIRRCCVPIIDGVPGVNKRAYLEALQVNLGAGSVQKLLNKHITGKTGSSACGYHQGGDSGNVRAGHGSALHIAVLIVEDGAVNPFQLAISARCGNIHPVTVAGIVGSGAAGADGAYGNNAVIDARYAIFIGVITGREEDHTTSHGTHLLAVFILSGIVVEIVHGVFERTLIFSRIGLAKEFI